MEGDNLLPIIKESIRDGLPAHLDSDNTDVQMPKDTLALSDSEARPVVAANAYLGAREIVRGLELGADIIIAGRVADASPVSFLETWETDSFRKASLLTTFQVIAAAWYWYSWSETDYDRLAGALVAGHLIECSAYVTGSNFAGFYEYPLDQLYDMPFGIAEINDDGSCVITKHEHTKGIVNADTVKCQFLYELQGNIYLNSDVKAYLDDVQVKDLGDDRCAVRSLSIGSQTCSS